MKERITRRYMAGLLDGEGYFGIMRNKYENGKRHFIPTIKMSLTNPEVLKEICLKLGGHIHIRIWDNAKWKKAYCWESRTFTQTDKVLSYVHEYLIIKRQQADILREFLDTKFKIGENLGSTSMPKEILEKREYLYYLAKKLNYRGVPPAETKSESSPLGDEAIVRTDMKVSEAVGNYCTVS